MANFLDPTSTHNVSSTFVPDTCQVREFIEHNVPAVGHRHCCVYFFSVPFCDQIRTASQDQYHLRDPRDRKRSAVTTGQLLGGMPVFDSDKHLQYARKCTFQAETATVYCSIAMNDIVSTYRVADESSNGNRSRRYIVLVRDPRDIVVSWMYYRCFKTYESAKQRLKKNHRQNSDELQRHLFKLDASYAPCQPLRANPDALWTPSVATAANITWSNSLMIMNKQTIESEVGRITDFYCSFLRGADEVVSMHKNACLSLYVSAYSRHSYVGQR